jgi:polyhydroxyalkanoate synthesis regulator phasin
LHHLQKRARDLVDAEDGLGRTVRDLVEENGLSPAEVKKRLDEVVGRLRANGVWERLRTSEAAVALSDYRDEMERRVEETVKRLLGSLQLASRADLEHLEGEVTALRRKLESLRKQSKTPPTPS